MQATSSQNKSDDLDLNSCPNNDFRPHDKIMTAITTIAILASVVKIWFNMEM